MIIIMYHLWLKKASNAYKIKSIYGDGGREAKNATEKGKGIPGLRNWLFAFASHVLTAYDLCKFDLAPINNCRKAFFAASVKNLEIVRSNFINR